MSDEAATATRRRWWPQSVRVRLTIVATLAFAITFSAAAFGLVRLVHNNLVDRIEETNQQQLDELRPPPCGRGDVRPPSDAGRQVCDSTSTGSSTVCFRDARHAADGYEAAQREIDTHDGRKHHARRATVARRSRTARCNSVSTALLGSRCRR